MGEKCQRRERSARDGREVPGMWEKCQRRKRSVRDGREVPETEEKCQRRERSARDGREVPEMGEKCQRRERSVRDGREVPETGEKCQRRERSARDGREVPETGEKCQRWERSDRDGREVTETGRDGREDRKRSAVVTRLAPSIRPCSPTKLTFDTSVTVTVWLARSYDSGVVTVSTSWRSLYSFTRDFISSRFCTDGRRRRHRRHASTIALRSRYFGNDNDAIISACFLLLFQLDILKNNCKLKMYNW